LNNTLILNYNFATAGATVTDSLPFTNVGSGSHTLQQQVEQYYHPKYSTMGSKAAPWKVDDTIFSIFLGINE